MALVDYFLKIEGVEGESRDEKHKGEIDISSFSFGVENPTTIGSATGGAGAGKARFNEFTITKTIDRSSPLFFRNCVSGAHYKTAILTARKSGEQPVDFLKITLSDVLVSSYRASGARGGSSSLAVLTAAAFATDNVFVGDVNGLPTDAIALSYAKLQLTEGNVQHIGVRPAASGQLTFDAATGQFVVTNNENGTLTVGTNGGTISRGVQEFDVSDLLPLINLPGSTAKLTLDIAEIREGAEPHLKPNPDLHFDVFMYAPADLELTPEDLVRSGERIASLHVHHNGDPAAASIDLTSSFRGDTSGTFGIRLQLRGTPVDWRGPVTSPEGATLRDALTTETDEESGDEKPGRDATASFTISLSFDSA